MTIPALGAPGMVIQRDAAAMVLAPDRYSERDV
jgi:hypothetical protein